MFLLFSLLILCCMVTPDPPELYLKPCANQCIFLMEMSFLSYAELCICLEICFSSRFMSVFLWPGMTYLVLMLSQNACCG